jgi:hypothetical protein
MKRSTALSRLATLAALACLCPAAVAQSLWQWRDGNGHMVYSDVPPPPSVQVGSIIKAPGRFAGTLHPVEAAAPATAAVVATGTQPAPQGNAKGNVESTASAEDAFEKRRAARLKAQADQALKDQAAQERQADCMRMQNYAAALQQNRRIIGSAADGSAQRLDDVQRQAELQRTTASLQQNCA